MISDSSSAILEITLYYFLICGVTISKKLEYIVAQRTGRLAQLARALARQARGHWFESSIAHHILQGFQAVDPFQFSPTVVKT